jgi:CCR4-NOT complex subunit CAF16
MYLLSLQLLDAADRKGVVYLGTEWASNPVVRSDIVVSHFLDSVGGYRHKARRDKLLALLDVDLDWYVHLYLCISSSDGMRRGLELIDRHMHQISDGERRRVQLCMGLMTEWDVLLLDEVCPRASACYRVICTAILMEGHCRLGCPCPIRPD